MKENKIISRKVGEDRYKIYNSNDIDPIAEWLGKFKYPDEPGLPPYNHDDDVMTFRDDACEVYDIAHKPSEWLVRAKDSPWYYLTEAAQKEEDRRERNNKLFSMFEDEDDE